jgi:hypothetical protein
MKANDPNLKPQYRMPRVFGALPGPRNVPKDKQHLLNQQRSRLISVTSRTDPAILSQLLPPECELDGDTFTVGVSYLQNIGWLAGRGYTVVSVTFPIRHASPTRGQLEGNFFAVVWENLADPIMTGREELGWAKIYAEIPEPVALGDTFTGQALWDGFRFLEIGVTGLSDAPHDLPPPRGQFHYKYIPQTGSLGEADVEYLEFAPHNVAATGYGGMKVDKRQRGQGFVRFNRARWEDVPFQYPIINALADLPVLEVLDATVTHFSVPGPVGDVSAGALVPVEPR